MLSSSRVVYYTSIRILSPTACQHIQKMPTQKLGRNDPCWCGSGKKYKYCHLNRETQTPLQPWEVSKRFRQAYSTKICLAPDSWKNECSGKISSAHTVPKGSLKQIARNGHVYSLKPSLEDLRKNEGRLVPELLGINKASTFTGFCTHHDNSIFAQLEKQPFSGTSEQCFLLGYRALTMELYKKHAAIKNLEILRDSDIGRTPEEQFMIQAFTQCTETGSKASAKDTDHYKSRFDSILKSQEYNTIQGYILEFKNPPPVMCSGAIYPEQDFKGVELQDIVNLPKIPDLLSFASLFGGEHGVVVFSWLSESGPACCAFIESLIEIPDQYVTGALLRFLFTHCENIHLAPDWWESLPQETQDTLIRRLVDSANPWELRPKAALMDDGMVCDPWVIVSRNSIL